MKALTTILLAVLVLVGCASTADYDVSYLDETSFNRAAKNLMEQGGFKANAQSEIYNRYGMVSLFYGISETSQEEANENALEQCKQSKRIMQYKNSPENCHLAYEGNKRVWEENIESFNQESIQLSKQALIAEYIKRCIEFGFEGKTEIATCFQQEVFNERQLAQQRLAQQPQIAQEEEVPFLLQMLGEIAIGVSEGYLEQVQHDIMHQNDRRPPIIFYPTKP